MNIIEVIVRISKFFPGVTSVLLHYGLVIVHFYHLFGSSPVFNTAFEEAQGIEWVANTFLAPIHYLCEGKTVKYSEDEEIFIVKQRFQYETDKKFYSPLALTCICPSLFLGGTLKAIAFLSPEVRIRHATFKAQLHSTKVSPNNAHFASLGMKINDWREGEKLVSQGYERQPGDENTLRDDKEALAAIVAIFSEHNIPFWVDCGTCIGAYRYGGVIPWDNDLDISILKPDFQNARNALNQLDSKKFAVQDWSSRNKPVTYLRIYVKKSHNHIDIYTNEIDTQNKTITYIISHEASAFMSEKWKERERLQACPIPFDVVFPLKVGLFDGIEVPVPNQTAKFLTYKYGPNIHPTKIYSQETGTYEKDFTHPYWKIPLAH